DTGAAQRRDRAQIVQTGYPTGGDDGRFGAGTHVAQQPQVRPTHHAVLADIGDDIAPATLGVESPQDLPQLTALGGPATRGQQLIAVAVDPDIEPDRDPLAMLGDRPGAPLRILQRRGAEVDPGAAGAQRRGQRVVVTDAARQLDGDVELADHLGDELGVGTTPERRVQVDQMNPFGTGRLPGERGLCRLAVLRLGAELAADQPNGSALTDVNGGQQGEAHSRSPYGRRGVRQPP